MAYEAQTQRYRRVAARNLGGFMPVSKKYTVTAAQIAAIGAATTGDVVFATLPANAIIDEVTWKPRQAVAGPAITAATARVITTNNNYGGAQLDVFQAPGNTVLTFDGVAKSENYAATTDVKLHMILTGANASVVNAGIVDIWLMWHTRADS